jgi:hypothetical protein
MNLVCIAGDDSAPAASQNSTTFTRADWIGQIQEAWAKGSASALELARILCRARRAMDFGDWARMWRSKRLPFAISKAKMLVRVGERLGDLDGQTFGRLPSGWSILYQLARLDRAELERLIQEGVIHPALTEREARQLAAQFGGESPRARSVRAVLRVRLHRFAEFVDNHLAEWNADERELAAEELTRLIEQIGNPHWIGRNGHSRNSITRCDLLAD